MDQIKIVTDDELIKKFKQLVLIKHGKLNLSTEGREVLKLYVDKYKHLLEGPPGSADPLSEVLGIMSSPDARDALKDIKRLERGEP
ncbi:MAG: hypothetical protein QXE79_07455 [Candidatus Bathyarchaeia archaeon]